MKPLNFDCSETYVKRIPYLKFLINLERHMRFAIPGIDKTISMVIPVIKTSKKPYQEKVCLFTGSAKLYPVENDLYIQNDEPVTVNYDNRSTLLPPGTWNITRRKSIDHFV